MRKGRFEVSLAQGRMPSLPKCDIQNCGDDTGEAEFEVLSNPLQKPLSLREKCCTWRFRERSGIPARRPVTIAITLVSETQGTASKEPSLRPEITN